MHAILASMGSDGDVYPFVALASTLRARGHRVTLAANEQYEAFARRQGFAFRALVSDEEWKQLLTTPDVWHPVKSAFVGARWVLPLLERQYNLLSELARDGEAVLVAYPPVFAARLVQEKLSRPMASIVLMPWMVLSALAPPALAGPFNLPRWTPRPVVNLDWRLLEAVSDVLLGRPLNRVRRSLDLPPVRRVPRWLLSPQLAIGLFPAWYAPPQTDWPPQLRLAGFPMFDGRSEDSLPRDVAEFCDGGPPPVAFTFGSGMMHAARTFRAGVEACEMLGARGIFLTKFPEQLPAPLPPSVHASRYAPFSQLFPRCAGVVHHGGVGTTSHALRAAIPQLILPMAWDQPDNAARVKRLGVGDRIHSSTSGAQIARALARVMMPRTQARCREVAAGFGHQDPLELAAGWIEELADRT
jgi:UDP:flavonoid glycosyltransferase YjiC (YdhE family)